MQHIYAPVTEDNTTFTLTLNMPMSGDRSHWLGMRESLPDQPHYGQPNTQARLSISSYSTDTTEDSFSNIERISSVSEASEDEGESFDDCDIKLESKPSSPFGLQHGLQLSEISEVDAKTDHTSNPGPVLPKRKRGRPRKHPLPESGPGSKTVPKRTRTKLGCLTCRRRKKKCDEAKPECKFSFYSLPGP
jgi:hypothetical protein